MTETNPPPTREQIETEALVALALNAPTSVPSLGVILVPDACLAEDQGSLALGEKLWEVKWDAEHTLHAFAPVLPEGAPETLPDWLAARAHEVAGWSAAPGEDAVCWVRACGRAPMRMGLCRHHHQQARDRWNPPPSRAPKRERTAEDEAAEAFQAAWRAKHGTTTTAATHEGGS